MSLQNGPFVSNSQTRYKRNQLEPLVCCRKNAQDMLQNQYFTEHAKLGHILAGFGLFYLHCINGLTYSLCIESCYANHKVTVPTRPIFRGFLNNLFLRYTPLEGTFKIFREEKNGYPFVHGYQVTGWEICWIYSGQKGAHNLIHHGSLSMEMEGPPHSPTHSCIILMLRLKLIGQKADVIVNLNPIEKWIMCCNSIL